MYNMRRVLTQICATLEAQDLFVKAFRMMSGILFNGAPYTGGTKNAHYDHVGV